MGSSSDVIRSGDSSNRAYRSVVFSIRAKIFASTVSTIYKRPSEVEASLTRSQSEYSQHVNDPGLIPRVHASTCAETSRAFLALQHPVFDEVPPWAAQSAC